MGKMHITAYTSEVVLSKRFQFITISLFLFSIIVRSQDVHVSGDLLIGDLTPEAPLPKMKLKMDPGTTSGILIENRNGTAQSWLPYPDGSIHLTGDQTDGLDGNLIFRKYENGDYADLMRLDGSDGSVQIMNLSQDSIIYLKTVFANYAGVLIGQSGPDILSINPTGFTSHNKILYVDPDGVSVKQQGSFIPFYASVNLPNGALITSFKVVFVDNAENADMSCKLYRMEFSNNNYLPLASTDTIGDNEMSIDSMDLLITVDNINYTYYLEVTPINGSWSGNTVHGPYGSEMIIKSAHITYSKH